MWGQGEVCVSKCCAYVMGRFVSIITECDHAVNQEVMGITKDPRGALWVDVHGDIRGHIDKLAQLWFGRRAEGHDKPARGEREH